MSNDTRKAGALGVSFAALAAASALGAPPPALAQEEASVGLEDIVVTAQRQEGNCRTFRSRCTPSPARTSNAAPPRHQDVAAKAPGSP